MVVVFLRDHVAGGGAGSEMARAKGMRAGKFRLISAWPFPDRPFANWRAVKAFVVPELNLGQMVHEVAAGRGRQGQVIPVSATPAAAYIIPNDSEGDCGGSPRTSTLEIPYEDPGRAPQSRRAVPAHGPHAAHLVPGCGIGTTVNCFTRALQESKANLDKVAMVSGIGCTGRVAGYAHLDSFHTTHGRAIPFATGLKLANPELQVVVYSGDGDLFAIGGNHFIHAARRNMDLKVICVNNLTYAMTGGQTAPTTPGPGH